MTGGASADGAAADQLGGDEFDGAPVSFLCEEMFGLGEEPSLEPFGAAFAGALHGEPMDVQLIASGTVPGVVAGMSSFSGDTGEGDEDFAFEPILGGPKHALLEFADAEAVAVWQDADPMDGPSKDQGDNGVSGFVVSGDFVVGGFHLFSVSEGAPQPRPHPRHAGITSGAGDRAEDPPNCPSNQAASAPAAEARVNLKMQRFV